jgi:alkylated DNA repair dioxygenase AlkB
MRANSGRCLAELPAAAPPARLPPRARKLAAKRAVRQQLRLDQPLPPPAAHEPPDALPFALDASLFPELSLPALLAELRPLLAEEQIISRGSGDVVPERRATAWLSDSGRSFAYSGKTMSGGKLTASLSALRDSLAARFGSPSWRFDSVLVNHYPSGASAMGWHSDPQGAEDGWAEETAVVSVGASRRFAFRSAAAPADLAERREMVVSSGDCLRMWGDCQARFQHSLLAEPGEGAEAERISLVFKRSVS